MKQLFLCLGLAAIFISCSVSSHSNSSKNNSTKPVAPGGAVLTFPVAGNHSSIGSFWGDGRDKGKRKHEGIDIFAKKGTEVVAVSNGTISSVGNGGIGGKTIWLQADEYEWTAYYAHLDSQFVSVGQTINKGDIIGTVGNTGNARYTSSHLHFGIYTYAGAVDPLPFVRTAIKVASTVVIADEKTKPPVKKNAVKNKSAVAVKKV